MILLVGASASGKTEIARFLSYRYGMKKAVTHTTRPIRPSETPDVDYHFVSKEEFLRLKKQDAFVETTEYNGNYYGCSKAECADDKCIILDPSGVHSFRALNDANIIVFYLRASEDLRMRRMLGRGDGEEMATKRIENDRKAFTDELLPLVDYVIDCETGSIESLGQEVYSLYTSRMRR
ncbi:MAG: AAA family ATPase [Bacilli bacterium]|nr:AAA family ATPase [Bacilli bacterium]